MVSCRCRPSDSIQIGEGGEKPMETFFSFILSVAANVVAHCIDKWLDEQLKAGKH